MPGAIEHRGSKAWVFPELEPASPASVVTRRVQDAPRRPVSAGPGKGAEQSDQNSPRVAGRDTDGRLRATTISFRDMARHGELLIGLMEARKRVFIDQLKWDLPTVDGLEFDQYDTPFAKWVVIHASGRILGGVRLMPTTSRCGIYSYTLRDAQLGLLDPIPRDVLFLDAPVDPKVWEASRLFLTEEVTAAREAQVQGALMKQMAATAQALGATHVIGIVPAGFARWLHWREMGAVPVGRRFGAEGARSQAALFRVGQTLH